MKTYSIDWPDGRPGEVRSFRLPNGAVLTVTAGVPVEVELEDAVAESLARKVAVTEAKQMPKSKPAVVPDAVEPPAEVEEV